MSKRYGEWDIKLRDKIRSSFQIRMIIYTIISLVFAMLTEAVIITGLFFVRNLTKAPDTQVQREIEENQLTGKKKEKTEGRSGEKETKKLYYHVLKNIIGFKKTGILGFIVFSFFLGIFLFILYFMLLTRSFTSYLHHIKEGIVSISQGDFNNKLKVLGNDEVGVIAEHINAMALDLQKLMEMEQSLEKQKNELITSVAHDLRTPLTSILGYLELLQKKENLTEEERRKFIQITYDKSVRLQKLIEDLFNFTKLDSGEIELHRMPIDMVQMMEQMVDEFYPIFEEAGLVCEWECRVDSAMIDADGDLMARAMENLFSNAVRYGRDGKKIRVHIEAKLDSVWISVINYGILIPEESLSHIFERFYRVEASRNQNTGGTGLGLNIVQKIVTLHGGRIFADSGTQGTRFRVILPLAGESRTGS